MISVLAGRGMTKKTSRGFMLQSLSSTCTTKRATSLTSLPSSPSPSASFLLLHVPFSSSSQSSHDRIPRNFSTKPQLQVDTVIEHNIDNTESKVILSHTQQQQRQRPRLRELRKKLQIDKHINHTDFQQVQDLSSDNTQKIISSQQKTNVNENDDTEDLQEFLSQLRTLDKQQEQQQALSKGEMLVDTYKRKHTYLRISLSERCNLRCRYCMPPEGVPLQPKSNLLTDEEIIHLTKLFVNAGVDKIRLTGGEPLLHPNIAELIQSISSLSKKENNVKSIGITTNGLTLSRQLDTLLEAGLTHVNISLDTLNADKFLEITRRNAFQKVMRAIDDASQKFPKFFSSNSDSNDSIKGRIKVNCVVMKGFNDDELYDFVKLTQHRNIDVRFIEWMPFNDNGWNQDRFVSYKKMKSIIQEKAMEEFSAAVAADGDSSSEQQQEPFLLQRISDGPNDTTKWWHVPGFKGRIGFITSMSEHFCGTCNRLRITADGKLKVCLFGKKEVSLRDVMRLPASNEDEEEDSSEDLIRVINAAVKKKTFALGGYGNAEGIAKANENRPMTLIGG